MKKVAIIGGGFAGSKIAKSLENDFDVTLIDTKDYFEFTPSILSAITDPACLEDIQIMHTHYLKKAKVIIGRAEKISGNEVFVGKRKIKFDYLAISSGSKYSFPFKEHDALITSRANRLRNHYEDLHNSKNVLIIGGGLSGVELAAEIATKCHDKKITIVHAMDRLIERQPEKASEYAKRFLEKKGVKIIFNELIKGNRKVRSKENFFTDRGKKIESDIAFLCVGITPNSDFIRKSFPKLVDKKGYASTDESLNLKGFRNIFVGGDVTDIKEEKTAQNSIEHAKVIASNIINLERGKPLNKYVHKERAMILSLGRHRGILTYKNFVIAGIIPSMIKRHIQNKEMGSLKG
jgi:NADH dehydrogenase FAD-containing subunit